MKLPLKNEIITATGDFGSKRSHGDLKRWVEANGGTWVTGVSAKVTHLICSKAHWKEQSSLVKSALKHKHIHIVSYDWLEDSLLRKTRKREAPYLMKTVLKAAANKKKNRKEKIQKPRVKKELIKHEEGRKKAKIDIHSGKITTLLGPVVEGRKEAQNAIHSDTHHLYRDATAFLYDINLSRPHLVHNRTERWVLRLYETDLSPHRYTFVAIHYVPGTAPDTRQIVSSQPFHTAFTEWKRFFLRSTGVEWDFRIWGRAMNPTAERRGENQSRVKTLKELCYGSGPATKADEGDSEDIATKLFQPGSTKTIDDIVHVQRPPSPACDSDQVSSSSAGDGDAKRQRMWERSRQSLANGELPPLPPRNSPQPKANGSKGNKTAKAEDGDSQTQKKGDPEPAVEVVNNNRYFTYTLPDLLGSDGTDGEALGEVNTIVEKAGPKLLGPVKVPGRGERAVGVGGGIAWKD